MNYEVVISKKAKSDISKIYSHILYKFKSKLNADSVLKKIYSELEDLSFMAGSYHRTSRYLRQARFRCRVAR